LCLALFIVAACASAEPKTGSVCVAPVNRHPDATSELLCSSGELSLKIDDFERMAWPKQDGVKIDTLDATKRHRVVVYCNGKPQQSFTFRFSGNKSRRLCLFLNDLYGTAQLWEAKRCPWCKCK